jgi:predicted nucleic acid-binding protein
MNVIADTSIWSLFLRRRTGRESRPLTRFKELLERDEIELMGIVKQEILSGLKEPAQFQRITEILSGFSLTLADADDHIVAAEFYNTCRKHGVQGSSIDFLICAMASRRGLSILTTDEDFKRYVKRLPISLH